MDGGDLDEARDAEPRLEVAPAHAGERGSARALWAEVAGPVLRAHAVRGSLAALAAWATTVAPAVLARSAPASARVLGVLALACGLGGSWVRARRWARHVGVSAFLALATATWLLAPGVIDPSRLEPVRGALGTLAWVAFALSWGDPWRREAPPPVDPGAPELLARSTLPPLAVPLAAFGAVAAFACLALAWRVDDVPRALFAQAAAIACAVGCIGAAAAIAVSRGRRRSSSGRRVSPVAVRSLLLLGAFAVAGLLATLAR